MGLIRSIIYCSLTVIVLADVKEYKIVNIDQGSVKGYKSPEHDIFVFHSIPYATAPTGIDRFKGPLPPPTWNQTLEAVEENVVCPQNDKATKEYVVQMRENCLVTTIYVPNTNKTNLPVLVYVHGGAYQYGFAERFTPKNFVNSKDIIVATFNYRVAAHGFLCLGTEKIPGNAGMKDQVEFLRWVQKNIASFGGSPNDVTIYGNSAGSRSVDLLMISPATSGLFKHVIGESGANLGAQTVQVNPIENAKSFARLLNFENVDDINALEQFYLNASYDLLTSIDTVRSKNYFFSPCVERDLGQEVVLRESPFKTLKSGKYPKVPMLYGFTEMEGSYRLEMFDEWKNEMNTNFSNFLPEDLQFPTDAEKERVARKVKEYYFEDKEINEENIILFVNYFTDTMYVYPMLRAIKIHVEGGHNSIYSYEYSNITEESPILPYLNIHAAFHSWTTRVVLDSKNESNITAEFKEMKRIFRDIYFSFISTGNPVTEGSSLPKWPAIQKDDMRIMSFNKTIEMKPLQHRSMFWEDIYNEYYREPMTPPDWSNIKIFGN